MTGGLTWIGFVEAKALADNGIRVAISARRGGDTAMYADMRSVLGEDTAMRPLNVWDERSVNAFCKSVRDEAGSIDILVNAAGICLHQTATGHSLFKRKNVLETNLTGPF